MSDFIKFLLKAGIRKALTLLSGILFAKGYLTQSEADSFVGTYLDEILASVLLAISGLWTLIYQKYVKDKVVTAKQVSPDTTAKELEQAVGYKVTP